MTFFNESQDINNGETKNYVFKKPVTVIINKSYKPYNYYE